MEVKRLGGCLGENHGKRLGECTLESTEFGIRELESQSFVHWTHSLKCNIALRFSSLDLSVYIVQREGGKLERCPEVQRTR